MQKIIPDWKGLLGTNTLAYYDHLCLCAMQSLFLVWSHENGESTKANRGETKSCLDRVFNFKLGCFVTEGIAEHIQATPVPRVENPAQGLFS